MPILRVAQDLFSDKLGGMPSYTPALSRNQAWMDDSTPVQSILPQQTINSGLTKEPLTYSCSGGITSNE